jgi:hypothetical protein
MTTHQENGPAAVEGSGPYQHQYANLILPDPSPETKAKQQAMILAALRVGPLTTVRGREQLGVLHVGGRIMELRRQGHRIETQTRTELDFLRRPHRVASYVLLPDGGQP